MNITNARLGYEPHRGDGALCVYFKDKREAVGFAEAILQEVQNIENSNLLVSECSLITINFEEERNQERFQAFREVFCGENQDVLISVPDLANLLSDGDKEI